MPDPFAEFYRGDGAERTTALPAYRPLVRLDSPEGYLADEGLRDAVNVALALGQPLLVTGEPGTGKTLLAFSVARELRAGVPDAAGNAGPLVFRCKTTSSATDLFYRFDGLRRFHDANRRDGVLAPPDAYVDYEALGLAILLALPAEQADSALPERLRGMGPRRCVVLADEIDKAPRDLPNDVLNEVEQMTFTVRETGRTFSATQEHKPFLILTSNSERDLPDAFLRRCVFYNVPFPDRERLTRIVEMRLDSGAHSTNSGLYDAIVALFEEMRTLNLRKRPATAEAIGLARLLTGRGAKVDDVRNRNRTLLLAAVALVAKTPEDRRVLIDWIEAS